MSSYRVVQVAQRGKLEIAERPLVDPRPAQVRIRVEACGVCHSDSLAVEGRLPNAEFPRVPGHEAIGRIDALGAGVMNWKAGQRVGVGYLGGNCGWCAQCRRGRFVHCLHQHVTGTTNDGGYAEVMYAAASGLSAVPDELKSVDAAPLLCAGLTTFNALRNSRARAGDLVAVQGVGGATVILATASSSKSHSGLLGGLRPGGSVLVVGLDGGPIEIGSTDLVLSERSVDGSKTGSAQDGEDTLA